MEKLFTTLYGSMLYGTNTPTSDKDIKHIVLPDFRDLLLGKSPKNKVKKTNTKEYEKNGIDDIDEEFIPIHVFARDFMAGQTYALELAYAVYGTHAEQVIHNPYFIRFCRELSERFSTSTIHAMVGYAINQATLYSNKGERLNAISELYKVIYKIATEPKDYKEDKLILHWDHITGEVKELAEKYPKYIQITEYDINPEGDKRPCIKILEKILPSSTSFEHNLTTIKATKDKFGARAKAAQEDQVDWKATSHALRIINEGIELLQGKPLSFPYSPDTVKHLLDIKNGLLPHAEVMQEIQDQMDLLKNYQISSPLPSKTHELQEELEEWLFRWCLEFYNLDPANH